MTNWIRTAGSASAPLTFKEVVTDILQALGSGARLSDDPRGLVRFDPPNLVVEYFHKHPFGEGARRVAQLRWFVAILEAQDQRGVAYAANMLCRYSEPYTHSQVVDMCRLTAETRFGGGLDQMITVLAAMFAGEVVSREQLYPDLRAATYTAALAKIPEC